MNTIQTFLAHNWGWLLAALVSAVLNLLARKKTPEAWEAWALKQPALALGIEVLRAFGIDPRKVLVAIKRYADRRAGNVPEDLWESLPVSPGLRGALRDPQKRAQIEALLLGSGEGSRPTVAPPPPPV